MIATKLVKQTQLTEDQALTLRKIGGTAKANRTIRILGIRQGLEQTFLATAARSTRSEDRRAARIKARLS